jgi:hypothetical protein
MDCAVYVKSFKCVCTLTMIKLCSVNIKTMHYRYAPNRTLKLYEQTNRSKRLRHPKISGSVEIGTGLQRFKLKPRQFNTVINRTNSLAQIMCTNFFLVYNTVFKVVIITTRYFLG